MRLCFSFIPVVYTVLNHQYQSVRHATLKCHVNALDTGKISFGTNSVKGQTLRMVEQATPLLGGARWITSPSRELEVNDKKLPMVLTYRVARAAPKSAPPKQGLAATFCSMSRLIQLSRAAHSQG